jgi:hypothetical protein
MIEGSMSAFKDRVREQIRTARRAVRAAIPDGVVRREIIGHMLDMEDDYDLHVDLRLDEWAKDDHPHAILARAHAVGALHLSISAGERGHG